MNFRQYIQLVEFTNKAKAIFVPESWAGEIASLMPTFDLDLPTITRNGRIEIVLDKKNPIYVQLSDGSKLFFSHDEFRKIKDKPQKGKNMVVVMQRHSVDTSDLPSQIVKCMVRD